MTQQKQSTPPPFTQAVYAAMEGVPKSAWTAAERMVQRKGISELEDPEAYRQQVQDLAWRFGAAVVQINEAGDGNDD